jgi:hypothetical protein
LDISIPHARDDLPPLSLVGFIVLLGSASRVITGNLTCPRA